MFTCLTLGQQCTHLFTSVQSKALAEIYFINVPAPACSRVTKHRTEQCFISLQLKFITCLWISQIRNVETNQCLDNMARKENEKVGIFNCHGMGGNQVRAFLSVSLSLISYFIFILSRERKWLCVCVCRVCRFSLTQPIRRSEQTTCV